MFTVFGNHTDLVSWTAEPHRRGSFQIMSSCIITISLCVWTALHLNILHYSDANRRWYTKRLMWRKLGWLCLGLLAPEMIAYTAWDQYRRSRRHVNKMSTQDATRDWGMVQAFYVVMGGFVVDLDNKASLYPKHSGRERLTLTPIGVDYIAKYHPLLLPQVNEEGIRDKSKANALAKFLVCVQAGWFIFQCITRMALSLPITLLEARSKH
ncbi:unnamed protein product [Aureobasidium vineae]|uniref:Uncharacterized protein n=1 Tax=Aureobasidium vineae TaxID=2773715 RepID=A0A9N8JAU2_9PEZI|nr:unnamed protein product [Aureobasidium vineae]